MPVYNVYAVDRRIQTTVTSDGSVVSAWINSILPIHRHSVNSLIVGIDVQWCPNGTHGIWWEDRIATLHLCVDHLCLIFQIIHCDRILVNLHQLLADDRIQFVGVDILSAAWGLRYLAGEITGMITEDPWLVRLSNWGTHSLSWEQIKCAAVDAFLTFTVFMELEFSY